MNLTAFTSRYGAPLMMLLASAACDGVDADSQTMTETAAVEMRIMRFG